MFVDSNFKVVTVDWLSLSEVTLIQHTGHYTPTLVSAHQEQIEGSEPGRWQDWQRSPRLWVSPHLPVFARQISGESQGSRTAQGQQEEGLSHSGEGGGHWGCSWQLLQPQSRYWSTWLRCLRPSNSNGRQTWRVRSSRDNSQVSGRGRPPLPAPTRDRSRTCSWFPSWSEGSYWDCVARCSSTCRHRHESKGSFHWKRNLFISSVKIESRLTWSTGRSQTRWGTSCLSGREWSGLCRCSLVCCWISQKSLLGWQEERLTAAETGELCDSGWGETPGTSQQLRTTSASCFVSDCRILGVSFLKQESGQANAMFYYFIFASSHLHFCQYHWESPVWSPRATSCFPSRPQSSHQFDPSHTEWTILSFNGKLIKMSPEPQSLCLASLARIRIQMRKRLT